MSDLEPARRLRRRARAPLRRRWPAGWAGVLPGALALSLLAGACAPPPPGGIESLEVLARRGAERRERALAALEARLVLRLEGRATGRLPAVSVQARLAVPDRVRLQARWLLGLLVDAAVRGDTLVAWMPSQRLGVRIPDLADSLGVREPALFLGRALAASWQAPREAWSAATPDSQGVRLTWQDGAEAWALTLDRAGRPRQLELARGERSVVVAYPLWRGAGAAAWPARIELADGAGWVRARLDIEDAHRARRARRSWFAMVIPENVAPLELDDLRRVLSSHGGVR